METNLKDYSDTRKGSRLLISLFQIDDDYATFSHLFLTPIKNRVKVKINFVLFDLIDTTTEEQKKKSAERLSLQLLANFFHDLFCKH